MPVLPPNAFAAGQEKPARKPTLGLGFVVKLKNMRKKYQTRIQKRAEAIQALSAYVPRFILKETLSLEKEEADAILCPRASSVSGSAMIADISGFSKLTTALALGEVEITKSPRYDSIKKQKMSRRASDGKRDSSKCNVDRELQLMQRRMKRYQSDGSHSSEGAEQLQKLISKYFTKMIDIIEENDGDVVRIAGDAIIVLFEAENLRCSAVKSANCAAALIQRLDNFEIHDLPLRLHVTVGSGTMTQFVLGGHCGRYEPLLVGSVFDTISPLLDLAKPGQVSFANATWELMHSNGNMNDEEVKLAPQIKPYSGQCMENCVVYTVTEKMFSAAAVSPMNKRMPSTPSSRNTVRRVTAMQKTTRHVKHVSPTVEILESMGGKSRWTHYALKAFAPMPVLENVEAARAGWLALNLRLSILFVRIEGLSSKSSDLKGAKVDFADNSDGEDEDEGTKENSDIFKSLQEFQEVFLSVQKCIMNEGGAIKEFTLDDKGFVVVAGFGIPPLVYSDASARAVRAAMHLKEGIVEFGCEAFCGVTTGVVLCASVGSQSRREFAMIGAVVNKSARLMCVKGNMGVLVDEDTHKSASNAFTFSEHEESPFQLKGSGLVHAFTPVEEIKMDGRQKRRKISALSDSGEHGFDLVRSVMRRGQIFGCNIELGIIMERVHALWRANRSSVVSITGPIGSGRAALCRKMKEFASPLALPIFSGKCTQGNKSSCWLTIIVGALEILQDMYIDDGKVSEECDQKEVLSVAFREIGMEFSDDLHHMLESGNVDSESVMDGMADHSDHTLTKQIANLLMHTAFMTADKSSGLKSDDVFSQDIEERTGKLIICIEDAHWMDNASVFLLRNIVSEFSHVKNSALSFVICISARVKGSARLVETLVKAVRLKSYKAGKSMARKRGILLADSRRQRKKSSLINMITGRDVNGNISCLRLNCFQKQSQDFNAKTYFECLVYKPEMESLGCTVCLTSGKVRRRARRGSVGMHTSHHGPTILRIVLNPLCFDDCKAFVSSIASSIVLYISSATMSVKERTTLKQQADTVEVDDRINLILCILASGNPKFVMELFLYYYQTGVFAERKGAVRNAKTLMGKERIQQLRAKAKTTKDVSTRSIILQPGMYLPRANILPHKLRSMISSEISRLAKSNDTIFCLRIASCFGMTFVAKDLKCVYPIESEKSKLPFHLNTLVETGILVLEQEGNATEHYRFATFVAHSVVYAELPLRQRRQIHFSIAKMYKKIAKTWKSKAITSPGQTTPATEGSLTPPRPSTPVSEVPLTPPHRALRVDVKYPHETSAAADDADDDLQTMHAKLVHHYWMADDHRKSFIIAKRLGKTQLQNHIRSSAQVYLLQSAINMKIPKRLLSIIESDKQLRGIFTSSLPGLQGVTSALGILRSVKRQSGTNQHLSESDVQMRLPEMKVKQIIDLSSLPFSPKANAHILRSSFCPSPIRTRQGTERDRWLVSKEKLGKLSQSAPNLHALYTNSLSDSMFGSLLDAANAMDFTNRGTDTTATTTTSEKSIASKMTTKKKRTNFWRSMKFPALPSPSSPAIFK